MGKKHKAQAGGGVKGALDFFSAAPRLAPISTLKSAEDSRMLESLSVSLSDSLSREEEGKKENKAKQHAGMNQV